MKTTFAILFAVTVVAGCSSSSGDAAPGTTKNGITDCGGVACQAGSHCEDARTQRCADGCTTDNNCPDAQKCGADGRCANGAPSSNGGTCTPHPDQTKYPGGVCCPPSTSPGSGCTRLPAYDGECTAVGLPSNAYACGGGPPASDCTATEPACKNALDCATNYGCNTKTGHCFRQDDSLCTGTPCNDSLDCPKSEHCNSAEGVCQAD